MDRTLPLEMNDTTAPRETKAPRQKVTELLKTYGDQLVSLSHTIHETPELAFQEHLASEKTALLLEQEGFQVNRGIGGMTTSIKAVYDSGKPGPTVAFLAEYDALPEIGHACGHNLIAASAVGAALVLSRLIRETGGRVVLMGTPAEEGGGGKILLLKAGAFDDVDFSLMIHPSNQSVIGRGSTACCELVMTFGGQTAHSSKPEQGINALRPLLQVFNAIDERQAKWPSKVKVNGIITAGGTASNVIVDEACGKFLIRGETREEVVMVMEELKQVAEEEAAKVGATFHSDHDEPYSERYPNLVLEERFKLHLAVEGIPMGYADPHEPTGSSDVGNVSRAMPTIHPYVAIASETVVGHTREFAAASASLRGDDAMLKSVAALALTGWEILAVPEVREAAMDEFRRVVSKN
ncbi:M20 family metallopeptidase [Anoxynatronum buryatiense]|uniref:Peptidase M20 domain-containing protein 2 n=1 Tax=Anoxynatronum buryatiense TaxID=489973 RepID=A0AA46AJJ7_9CLOT|nr:M20 family metallopeptidase [Anoxynatronum buryatiense]SMP62516.1 amidohydrolase [Anoxynatronum buryatiense]